MRPAAGVVTIRSVQSVRVFRHALLVTALCLVTFFAGLGRSAIGDADEAFYAQSAREMVEQGDWITPHYNYEYRFQKPILGDDTWGAMAEEELRTGERVKVLDVEGNILKVGKP